MKPSIAIIGAGISGLTLAKQLSHVAEVVIFEKSRGVGGRLSTRYAEPFSFDHGAPFFTARSNAFQQFLAPYFACGLVQKWTGNVITLESGKKTSDKIWHEPHYVAVPTMNSLCKALIDNTVMMLNCEIVSIENKKNHRWQLSNKNGQSYGPFDWVISTAPSPQTSTLFEKIVPLDSLVSQYRSCYSLMLGFQRPWTQSWIAAEIENSPLQWLFVDSSKPQRDKNLTALVIHASHLWTESHLNEERTDIEFFLRQELQSLLELNVSAPCYSSLHFWRYALINKVQAKAHKSSYFLDQDRHIASVSDCHGTSRVEDAWLNACELASRITSDL